MWADSHGVHATRVEYRNCNENFRKKTTSRRSQSRIGILKTVSGNAAEVIAFGRLLKKVSGQNLETIMKKAPVSQAAACDGLFYSVNYNGQNSGTQGYALPLFED